MHVVLNENEDALNHVWKNLGSYLRTAICRHSLVIDLFRLFILFSHFRPRMVSQRTVCFKCRPIHVHPRAYVCYSLFSHRL